MQSEKLRYRRIERLNRDQRQELAEMLVEIFLENPVFLYAFPDEVRRQRGLLHLFLASMKDAENFGYIDVLEDDKIRSIFIYYPPFKYPMSIARVMRQIPHYLQLIGVSFRSVWRLYWLQKYLDKIRPQKAHCHALFLGSFGSARYGAILIRKSLQIIESNNWPVYLETQDARTTKLYSRFGANILTCQTAIPGAPCTWTMWRDPSGIKLEVDANLEE